MFCSDSVIKNVIISVAYTTRLNIFASRSPECHKIRDSALVRILELRVLIVVECSKITGADSDKMSKN